ncbi:MAG: cytochrome c biogenesis heme-transporting ATPase CcmA [Gammaproteobacteria bacterium]|nr:cytochrome c biogenesis heme-transporting ATPase CcmA [Gammaproteobacteria bacterium]
MQQPILTINEISFERNNTFLFENISCSLVKGDVLQIAGTNGSGKSTLLRILAGLLEPESGSISWKNKCIYEDAETYKRDLHFLGHQNGIKMHLTVHENLKHYCALTGITYKPSTINSIINKLKIDSVFNTQTSYLSAGQLRRLSLAKLLLNPQRLWLLDEPATALDSEGQQLLIDLISQHQSAGGITILATHQPLPLTVTMKKIQLGSAYVS